jgi:hypothetical protein
VIRNKVMNIWFGKLYSCSTNICCETRVGFLQET